MQHGQLTPATTPLKKMVLPPPPSYANRSLARSSGAVRSIFLPPVMTRCWRTQSSVDNYSCWVHECQCHAVSRRRLCTTLLPIFQPLPPFCLSFHGVFLNLGGGDGGISGWVTVTHSTVTYSQNSDYLWVSVISSFHREARLLWPWLTVAYLQV